MMPQFVDAIRVTRIINSVNYNPKKRLFIGLDVDFESETAVSAFALYAKLGFNRWWQPCSSISSFNYHTLIDSDSSSDGSLIFPFAQAVLDRPAFLSDAHLINSEGPKVFTHFCMVMLWGADDFGSIGKDILKAVQKSLEKYPSKAKKH